MRTVSMQWNLRQVMADRAIFATSELVPLLADRDIHLSREHVYRLVTKTPQRLNTDVLVALCDILGCTPNDLITPVVETTRRAKTGTNDAGGKIGTLRPVRTTIRRPKGAQ
jgi:DNA-binding Xre family transcriptional regulator